MPHPDFVGVQFDELMDDCHCLFNLGVPSGIALTDYNPQASWVIPSLGVGPVVSTDGLSDIWCYSYDVSTPPV